MRNRLIIFIGICAAMLLVAQAPKPGVGTPLSGYGAPAGTLYVRTMTTTVANTTDEVALLGTGVGSTTIAANILHPGCMLRLEQRGVISTVSNPTMRYRIKMNDTVVLDTGAAVMPGLPANANFIMQTDIVCRSSGTSGIILAAGGLTFQTTQGQLTTACNWAPITTTTFDTTVPVTFNSSIQWGTASPSNTISVMIGDVRIFN